MQIVNFPYRTNTTRLSNEQLMLLDFLFDAQAPLHMLKEDKFSIHHNVPYSHGFSDTELELNINKFENGGIFLREFERLGGKDILFYGLTSKGGNLWEKERRPHWHLYIEDSAELIEKDNIWKVCLRSPSINTLNTYLDFCIKNDFIGAPLSTPEYKIDNSCRLIYWKNYMEVHEYNYDSKNVGESNNIDWQRIEPERKWWRTIDELQKFVA